MAFGDFLNTGIGGTTPINQQTTVAGTAGAPIGPTYGDLLRTGLTYGSRPGSSAPVLASSMAPSQRSVIPPMGAPEGVMKTPQEKQAEQGDDSLGAVLGVLLKLLAL